MTYTTELDGKFLGIVFKSSIDKKRTKCGIFVIIFMSLLVSSATASSLLSIPEIIKPDTSKLIINKKTTNWTTETNNLSKIFETSNFYTIKLLKDRPCNISTRLTHIGLNLSRTEQTGSNINERHQHLKERLNNYNENKKKILKRAKIYNEEHNTNIQPKLVDVYPLEINNLNLTDNYERIKTLFSSIIETSQGSNCSKICSFNKIDKYTFDINNEIFIIQSLQNPINRSLTFKERELDKAEKYQRLAEEQLTILGV